MSDSNGHSRPSSDEEGEVEKTPIGLWKVPEPPLTKVFLAIARALVVMPFGGYAAWYFGRWINRNQAHYFLLAGLIASAILANVFWKRVFARWYDR
jgi:hypothetical protein